MSPDKWLWMPHPAHFICASDCRFHLSTVVGDFIVSTIGELLPDSAVREILAESRGIKLEGKGDARRASYMKLIGFEEIGCDRTYETMVFEAVSNENLEAQCCPYIIIPTELDFIGYNNPVSAQKGHMEMCLKWSKRKK